MWRLFEGGLCTITAQILARSLANFYRQYADRHMNLFFIYFFIYLFTLKFMGCGNERERTIWQFVVVKKQMDVSFSFVCPVIDNEIRHNSVKVVCGSIRLSPRGSTTTLTILWRNSWSITGQTHKNWRQFVNSRAAFNRVNTLVKVGFALVKLLCRYVKELQKNNYHPIGKYSFSKAYNSHEINRILT